MVANIYLIPKKVGHEQGRVIGKKITELDKNAVVILNDENKWDIITPKRMSKRKIEKYFKKIKRDIF